MKLQESRTADESRNDAPSGETLLLDMHRIQARLSLSRPSLYALIHNGTLKTFRVGGRRYSTLANVRDCVARLEANSETEARNALTVEVPGRGKTSDKATSPRPRRTGPRVRPRGRGRTAEGGRST